MGKSNVSYGSKIVLAHSDYTTGEIISAVSLGDRVYHKETGRRYIITNISKPTRQIVAGRVYAIEDELYPLKKTKAADGSSRVVAFPPTAFCLTWVCISTRTGAVIPTKEEVAAYVQS